MLLKDFKQQLFLVAVVYAYIKKNIEQYLKYN